LMVDMQSRYFRMINFYNQVKDAAIGINVNEIFSICCIL